MAVISNQQSAISGECTGVRPHHSQAFYVCLLAAGGWLLAAVCGPLVVGAEELKAPKVGYLNLARIFDEYQRTKELDQTLERKGAQKQSELEGRVTELKKLRENLELLNDEAREAKAQEIEEKSDEFQRLKARSQRDLVRERNEIARELLDEIEQVVKEYAQAQGFSMILDQRALLFGQDASDVTDEILRLLNERYATRAKKAGGR